jgi:hypothetical protein
MECCIFIVQYTLIYLLKQKSILQGDNVVMFGPNANPMYYQSQNLDGFFRNDQNGQDARNNRNERSGFRIDRLFSNHKRW